MFWCNCSIICDMHCSLISIVVVFLLMNNVHIFQCECYIVYGASTLDNCHTVCKRDTSAVCTKSPWWCPVSNILECPPEQFSLPGMYVCHPWLNCSHLQSIDVKELINVGAVKAVYRSEWQKRNVAYSILNNPVYKDDFLHGLNMLQILNPSSYVVQLIGFCREEHIILTEYHKLGSAVNIIDIISAKLNDSLIQRVKLCLNYAQLLDYLHNGPAGTRVFCDSNDLYKLLSQLLVNEKLTLVLNDLDALPEVNKENRFGINCGHNQIHGTFVAPEQLWQSKEQFDAQKMPGYDEKTDIWKSAAVCQHFLGNEVKSNVLAHYRLFSLHKSCKDSEPQKRPTAKELIREYTEIIALLSLGEK